VGSSVCAEWEEQLLSNHMNDAQRDSYKCMSRALQNNTSQVQAYYSEVLQIPNQVADVVMKAQGAQREMIRCEFVNWMADRPLQPPAQQGPPRAPQAPTEPRCPTPTMPGRSHSSCCAPTSRS
jgi:hypothetical protein